MSTVEKVLIGLVCFICTVSALSQIWGIFVNKTWLAGGNGLPPANILSLANPEEDSEYVWAKTPATCKYVAIQNSGWAVSTLIVWFSLPLVFDTPGSVTTICESVAVVCVVQQCVWWGACYRKVDATESYKRTFLVYFTQTTAQELGILGASAAYLGFFAGISEATTTEPFGRPVDWVRYGAVSLMTIALVSLYGIATFFKPDIYPTLGLPDPKDDDDPAEVWARTPAASKISCLRSGAWCLSLQATNAIILATFNPIMIKDLCKALSLIMIFWQFVWYGAMLGKIDDSAIQSSLLGNITLSEYKRPWTAYFWKETFPMETVLFLLFFIMGFLLP